MRFFGGSVRNIFFKENIGNQFKRGTIKKKVLRKFEFCDFINIELYFTKKMNLCCKRFYFKI